MKNLIYAYQNVTLTFLNKNQHFFACDKEVKALFDVNDNELENLLYNVQEKRGIQNTSDFFYKEDGSINISITYLLLMGLELDKEFVKDFYLFLKKNDRLNEINSLYLEEIESIFVLDPFIHILDSYEEFMTTIKKTQSEEEDDLHPIYIWNSPDTLTLKMLINRVKNKYHLHEDFGKEKEENALEYIFYLNETEDEEQDELTYEEEASKYFYYILKEKPFIEGNEEIACLVALYFLNANQLLYEDGAIRVHPTDFAYAMGLIENSSLSKKEIINKIKYIFVQDLDHHDRKIKELFHLVQKDNSFENVINYVVAYVENYVGYQGYYDYYKGGSCVYKIHYHGQYSYFKLNVAQTMNIDNALCFDGVATVYIEAPESLQDRDEIIASLYQEIQYRSYDDVIEKELKKSLIQQLKPYYDLSQIQLQFNIKWKIEINSEYEF